MRDAGARLDLDLHVYGPEVHMTAIVSMALGLKEPQATKLEERFVLLHIFAVNVNVLRTNVELFIFIFSTVSFE